MKTSFYGFKIFTSILIVLLSFNYSFAQFISNIGVGAGFLEGEPSSITVERVQDCIVSSSFACSSPYPSGTVLTDITTREVIENRSLNIQFMTFSYEPRVYIFNSAFNNVSLSLGLPINLSLSLQIRDGYEDDLEDYEELDMMFQGALMTYLNFGNGASYESLYEERKYGFSLGAGLMYSHAGVFRNELKDLNPPPNNLMDPVISLAFRYLSARFVLSEFSLLIRPPKSYTYIREELNECCQVVNRGAVGKEFGLLFQYKIFFE